MARCTRGSEGPTGGEAALLEDLFAVDATQPEHDDGVGATAAAVLGGSPWAHASAGRAQPNLPR